MGPLTNKLDYSDEGTMGLILQSEYLCYDCPKLSLNRQFFWPDFLAGL